AGTVLMSDMVRVLLSIPHDSVGWHDPLGGCTNAAMITGRYGATSYQEHRNQRFQNARDGFLIELGKHGLGKRDLAANVNLFSKVVVDAHGAMRFHPGNSQAGDCIDLRAEMDVLVVLSNTPHPLDPGRIWDPPRVTCTVWRSGAAGMQDPCRLSCPENGRAYTLTERYVA
ncbi:MAG: urea amidolyase associated protein UAAP1, partial [Planctomycetota bacterium]